MGTNREYKDMPQWERVVTYIRKHGSITSDEAKEHLAIMRLPSRIHDLIHKHGYQIEKKRITVKNRWGQNARIVQYSEVSQDG